MSRGRRLFLCDRDLGFRVVLYLLEAPAQGRQGTFRPKTISWEKATKGQKSKREKDKKRGLPSQRTATLVWPWGGRPNFALPVFNAEAIT